MKLDENERGNITRLMKVKDMMLEQAHNLKKNSMKLKGKVKPPATETFLELAGGLFTYSPAKPQDAGILLQVPLCPSGN